MKYSKAITDKLYHLISSGKYTIEDCCKQAGISESIFYKWKNEKLEFLEAIKRAEEQRLESFKSMAMSGLSKLLDVYEYDEISTEIVKDKEGNPSVKTKKITKKRIMPNPTAIIFTLTNVDQENFKHRSTVDKNITLRAKLDQMRDSDLLKMADLVLQDEGDQIDEIKRYSTKQE